MLFHPLPLEAPSAWVRTSGMGRVPWAMVIEVHRVATGTGAIAAVTQVFLLGSTMTVDLHHLTIPACPRGDTTAIVTAIEPAVRRQMAHPPGPLRISPLVQTYPRAARDLLCRACPHCLIATPTPTSPPTTDRLCRTIAAAAVVAGVAAAIGVPTPLYALITIRMAHRNVLIVKQTARYARIAIWTPHPLASSATITATETASPRTARAAAVPGGIFGSANKTPGGSGCRIERGISTGDERVSFGGNTMNGRQSQPRTRVCERSMRGSDAF